MFSENKIKEIVNYYLQYGIEKTSIDLNISHSSIERAIRSYKKSNPDFELNNTLKKISELYTPEELKALAKGGRIIPGQAKVPIINFEGDYRKIGYFTDPHMGSVYFIEKYFFQMLEIFHKEKIDTVVCSGDITHGMNKHQDLIYELTHIGYDAQEEYAEKNLAQLEWDFYCINGNHDRWYIKGNGANIVKHICENLQNKYKKKAFWLGHDEGDISLNGNVTLKLWHGEDGNTYATSYRLQKIVEAFTGGEKPHILLTGHTHKQGYFMIRFVHVVSGGALSIQSKWMRSKKIENHTGFWIIELQTNKNGVVRFKPEWFPFYA